MQNSNRNSKIKTKTKINGTIKFGDTLLFLDEQGHTPKSQIEYEKHKNLSKLRSLAKKNSRKYGYILTEKPVTIVNRSFFNKLDTVVRKSIEMWKKLNYWHDNILYRTGSYTKRQGLLSKNFPNKGVKKNCTTIKSLLKEANNPEQFLLHPLPSTQIFKTSFFATRCYMLNNICSFEIGYNGIEQTWQLEQAKNIIKGEIFNSVKLNISQGTITQEKKKVIKRIGHGLHQFCLLAPGLLVPKRDQGTKPIIYEFKTFYLKESDKLVIEFIDFEIFE